VEETPCASRCSNLEEHAHLQIIMRRRSFDVLPTLLLPRVHAGFSDLDGWDGFGRVGAKQSREGRNNYHNYYAVVVP
jgi:hypothetical protein